MTVPEIGLNDLPDEIREKIFIFLVREEGSFWAGFRKELTLFFLKLRSYIFSQHPAVEKSCLVGHFGLSSFIMRATNAFEKQIFGNIELTRFIVIKNNC